MLSRQHGWCVPRGKASGHNIVLSTQVLEVRMQPEMWLCCPVGRGFTPEFSLNVPADVDTCAYIGTGDNFPVQLASTENPLGPVPDSFRRTTYYDGSPLTRPSLLLSYSPWNASSTSRSYVRLPTEGNKIIPLSLCLRESSPMSISNSSAE